MDDKPHRYEARDERVLAGRVSLITAVFTATLVLAEHAITGSNSGRSGELALLAAAVVVLGLVAFAGLPRLAIKHFEGAYLAGWSTGAALFAGLLATTGGSESHYGELAFIFGAVCAYFLSFSNSATALVLLSGALASPLAYETGSQQRADLAGSLLVAVPVLLLISGAIALAKRRLAVAEQLARSSSITDSLTGLTNLRGLQCEIDDVLDGGVNRGSVDELGNPVIGGVVLIDLDNFAAINEDHGVEEGDRLLAEIAAALRDAARTGDTVARIAGDVFAIFAPDITEGGVKALAQRSVRAVSAASVEVRLGPAKVTASAGYSVYPSHAATRESLIAAADSAMYRVKREGKNAVAGARSLNSL